jgi:hypothetical protein
MSSLALKLVLTPALIALASLIGRRWGPAVGGWLVGLPLTSGPVVLFLALGQGTHFAAAAATGTLAGTISGTAFCLAYAALAVLTWQPWPIALAGASLAFALSTAALAHVSLPLVALFVLVVAAVALALLLILALRLVLARVPDKPAASAERAISRWDLPTRMLVATALVLALTAAASSLGARLTGLLTTFPVYATILAVFAHRQQGPVAATSVLRGLLAGLFGFSAFFLAIAGLIERTGIGPAFAVAVTLDLALQGLALLALRRASASSASPSPAASTSDDLEPLGSGNDTGYR